MRVLRLYHSGRDPSHRLRERALLKVGVDVTLVVPARWPDGGSEHSLSNEGFRMVELPVGRAGDVNRHSYDRLDVQRVLEDVRPDLLDLHEEPFALPTRQWLEAASGLPAVGYTAQNIDKRWPPPFHNYEKAALARLGGLYPCSRQAASVARGKGFRGLIDVLPLGVDSEHFRPGDQAWDDSVWTLLLVGRLVPEKGVTEAVRMLSLVRQRHDARLIVVGEGPERAAAQRLASELALTDAVEFRPWAATSELAALYRRSHVVLLPSRSTRTWVEQFGRVITEGQTAGCVVVGWASGSIPEVGASLVSLSAEGDVQGLANDVIRLREDRSHYEGLRTKGLQRAGEVSWTRVASRQAALYDAVLAGRPAASPSPAGRGRALAEFGPPALVTGGGRPFALPVLRADNPLTRGLGRVVDALSGARRRSR